MTTPTLFELPPLPAPRHRRFHGETYDPARDHERLSGQLERVYEVMKDGAWRTLAELSQAAHAPEASVSARLRDLRRMGYRVERRRRGEESRGLWEYRVSE